MQSHSSGKIELTCLFCGKTFWKQPSHGPTVERPTQGRFCSRPCMFANRPKHLVERFWSKVDRSDVDGCWPWIAGKDEDGYGRTWDGVRTLGAHVLAYRLSYGEIPEGLQVRHSCDNRPCCRPDHLSVGTSQDNATDMVERGRSLTGASNPSHKRQRAPIKAPEHVGWNRGSKHGHAKLTEEAVCEIWHAIQSGELFAEIAERYGVSQPNISMIATGKRWAHVTAALAAQLEI